MIKAVRAAVSSSDLLSRNDVSKGAYLALCDAEAAGWSVVLERRTNIVVNGFVGRSASAGPCWWDERARALVFTTWA
jgi:hypothetical protein